MEVLDAEHKRGGDPQKKDKVPTKVIVRRLPPNMDRATFLNQISPVPPYDYFYMVRGDASLGENSFARAYINFTNVTDIYDFKEKFDNYVFLDGNGHEFPAVVEFAAFQKIPKRRIKKRVDPKVATIETDPYYLEFVEMINKPPAIDEKPEYTFAITSENKENKNEAMTPLLEYVKNKRAEKTRIREERREERKRKEFERKKFREDERKKRFDEKSPVKSGKAYTKVPSPKDKEKAVDTEESKVEENNKDEKEQDKSTFSNYKNRDKYDDRKKEIKPKIPSKKEYLFKRDSKRHDDLFKKMREGRSNYDDYKKEESPVYQKKVKKYSEKREERKIEAMKKLELEQQLEDAPIAEEGAQSPKNEPNEEKREKDDSPKKKKRIRNKDRPSIAIYRPGMLSKRKQTDGEPEVKEVEKE